MSTEQQTNALPAKSIFTTFPLSQSPPLAYFEKKSYLCTQYKARTMQLDENWRDIDLNVDSLWIMGPRAKGSKRENNYHGNFAPQIPSEMIRRYTEPNEVVLDMFMGSGTTLFECETLQRHYIGFDINEQIISYVRSKMSDCNTIRYCIEDCDITDTLEVESRLRSDLQKTAA